MPKDTHRTATTDRAQLQLPEQVTLAVAELAGAARESLLALAVGAGLQAALEAELTESLGRDRYARDPAARVGYRNGHAPVTVKTTSGPVTLDRPSYAAPTRRLARPFGLGRARSF